MWIEKRGRQHRVYYRNPLPEKPSNRDNVAFYAEADARGFIDLAGQLGLATALAVTNEPDEDAATAIIARALEARAPRTGLLRAGSPAPATAQEATPGATADPRTVGMTFEELWARFLTKIRHVDEGTHKLYEGYGKNHLIPFFGGTDIGLILRTKPLRAGDAPAGALYVDDDWVTGMLKKERLNNVGRPVTGSPLSMKFVDNVLTVLGQCFDLAVTERPALLEVNPAKEIRLPKHDRREMHFLEDAAAYAALRGAMTGQFQALLDFLVGTGARYGEAAGLWVQHLHLDAARPHVDIRAQTDAHSIERGGHRRGGSAPSTVSEPVHTPPCRPAGTRQLLPADPRGHPQCASPAHVDPRSAAELMDGHARQLPLAAAAGHQLVGRRRPATAQQLHRRTATSWSTVGAPARPSSVR